MADEADSLDRPPRRRGGRPRVASPRRVVGVRVSPDEWTRIAERAAALGIGPHTLLREAALGRRLSVPIPAVNRSAWAELAATTSNLNQVAGHLNRGGVVAPDEVVATVERVAEQVRRLRLQLLGIEPDEAAK